MVARRIQAEIEKEKLTSILAAGTATQQQITKQKELARAAEENARSEAERLEAMRSIEFKNHINDENRILKRIIKIM